MNANELADKIEDARNETDFQKWAGQAPDMLRQQQAEIEALKKEVEGRMGEETYQHCLDKLRQQQAEIAELKHMNKNWQISENILLLELEKLQHRELTDEEIIAVGNAVVNHIDSNEGWIEFARAILRKAQEK